MVAKDNVEICLKAISREETSFYTCVEKICGRFVVHIQVLHLFFITDVTDFFLLEKLSLIYSQFYLTLFSQISF